MTGRRLYDLFCDAWVKEPQWIRDKQNDVIHSPTPPAWPFLSSNERRVFSAMAARLTGVRR